MKKAIIFGIMAMVSFMLPANLMAEDSGTHGGDFSSDDWGDDVELGFNFQDDSEFTGVETIKMVSSSMKIGIKEGEIMIDVQDGGVLPIYNLKGEMVVSAQLQPGMNRIELPSSGIYIVAGRKVMK